MAWLAAPPRHGANLQTLSMLSRRSVPHPSLALLHCPLHRYPRLRLPKPLTALADSPPPTSWNIWDCLSPGPTTFAQPSALANITGFSEWSEAVERLEQSSIQEAFLTVGIPADSLPNYSTPQDFAKGFRRCSILEYKQIYYSSSILEYKQISYSSSTSPQEQIPSTLKR